MIGFLVGCFFSILFFALLYGSFESKYERRTNAPNEQPASYDDEMDDDFGL